MKRIIELIKQRIRVFQEVIGGDDFKRSIAAFRISFFFILFTGTFLGPLGVIFHMSPTLIWILSMIFGFIVANVISSSLVFSTERLFLLETYMKWISILSSVSFVLILSFFHIKIKPL